MKAVFTILAHRDQAGAAVRAGAPADAVCGAVPEVVVARGRDQPTGRVSAADEKPSHDRSTDKLRTVRTVRGFLLVQIAMFLVLVTIHFGLLIGGYRHPAAATTESVIAGVLVLGLLLTRTRPPWSQRAATAAQLFGTLGVLVGLFTIALGIGPRTTLDLCLNVVLLLTLIAGLAITRRGAEHVQAAWMASLAKQTQPPRP
jgi:hypothetical protein